MYRKTIKSVEFSQMCHVFRKSISKIYLKNYCLEPIFFVLFKKSFNSLQKSTKKIVTLFYPFIAHTTIKLIPEENKKEILSIFRKEKITARMRIYI